MDASHLDDPGDEAEVIYLFDADADDTACRTPSDVFAGLDRAAIREGLGAVSVHGVVTGLRYRGRVCTFDLAEFPAGADTPVALLRVVLFAERRRAVEADLARSGQRLRDGLEVLASGAVRFDPAFGGLRLIAETVAVVDGEGELAARTAALVTELEASGLMTRQRALVVPGRPLRVGLITARGSAGEADLAELLESSGIEWQLRRERVPMSGPNAPTAVADAIGRLCRAKPDVIVVARGGGSGAELACWDSQTVARAIAEATVPVWTAIGHASDATIADLVANRSCATPSAAAAALVQRVRDFERYRHERAVLAEHRERMAGVQAKARRARLVAASALVLLVIVLLLLVAGR